MIWLFLIPAVLLFIGVGDLPTGYYTFLRIVVFISSGLIAIESYAKDSEINLGVVLFAVIALLFNPIFPIYLRDKEMWSSIDAITGMLYVGFGIYTAVQNKKAKNE